MANLIGNQIAQCRIDSLLGEGGMGTVYRTDSTTGIFLEGIWL